MIEVIDVRFPLATPLKLTPQLHPHPHNAHNYENWSHED